jgi:lipopolysaccharide transport system ATP-binding protein
MKPAITASNVSKLYALGPRRDGAYRTIRESIMDAAAAPWRRLRRLAQPREEAGPRAPETIWALDDVSFEVQPGEVIGIVGRNGAGKSTLLKIFSRITEPSRGRVEMRGRVGSLLEVGTGFHPELTGRENILLNGAILGMSRREIARKFDEIVAFAEVDRFLDTPVKRYSSGMHVRLAFAVAAHLEPEILIVDEVLAVGDAAFQKKCLGKMGEVSLTGRTVLFVSHHMAAVKSLCHRAILLESGRVTCDSDVDEVVNRYLHSSTEMSRTGIIPAEVARFGTGLAQFRSVRLTDADGREVSQVYYGQPFRVVFECDVLEDVPEGLFEVSISALDGTHLVCSMTIDWGRGAMPLARGRHIVEAEFDNILLPREYTVDLGVHHHDGTTFDFVQRTLDFMVLKVAESGDDHHRWHGVRGYVRPPARWDFQVV